MLDDGGRVGYLGANKRSKPKGHPVSDEQVETTPPQTERRDIDRGGVPGWFTEIFLAGPRDGFFQKLGKHAAVYVERDREQLVISFDNLSDAGSPRYDAAPWAYKFIHDNDWSHLGILSAGPYWSRDQRLIDWLEGLRDSGFFKQFSKVTLTGTSMGAFAALTFSRLIPGAVVVALSPQTNLDRAIVPWEHRFLKGQDQDWTLRYSDAAEGLETASKVYVLYDPFEVNDRKQAARLPDLPQIHHLHAFGHGHKSAVVLRRAEVLKEFMTKAIRGTLTDPEFYRMIRARRDVMIYRKTIEAHLAARGKDSLLEPFRMAFRRRRREIEAQNAAATQNDGGEGDRPGPSPTAPQPSPHAVANTAAPLAQTQTPDALVSVSFVPAPQAALPAVVGKEDAGQRDPAFSAAPPTLTPRTQGNVWMAHQEGARLSFLSDCYLGQVMGFTQYGRTLLAETRGPAIGMLAFGSGQGPERPLAEPFTYHVVDETLRGEAEAGHARSLGVQSQRLNRQLGRALQTVVALDAPVAGHTPADTAAAFDTLCARLTQATRALSDFGGRRLFVDRVGLGLLGGAPLTPEAEADALYADTARHMGKALARITGQGSTPAFVIRQGAGTRTDGTSEVILAEGRLNIRHPTLGFVVATPSYPFAFLDDMPATLTPQSHLLADEMETIALYETQSGRNWQCPLLRYAQFHDPQPGTMIEAEFTTMAPLVLDKGPHGFTLEGVTNGAKITSITLSGPDRVTITLDTPPEGENIALCYAFGGKTDKPTEKPVNQGALRDTWATPSQTLPGITLHRYALSARVPVFCHSFKM